ncbi:MAG: beta-galactosidase trimerization domain-containing protein, partial [Janthinobacterium lividum]
IVPDDFARRLAASGAEVVIGPRTGSKTANLTIPETLPPGPLAEILPMRVWRVESLRPGATEPVAGGTARHWRDFVEAGEGTEVVMRFGDGLPAVLRYGRVRYLASLFDAVFTQELFLQAARAAGLPAVRLPDGVRFSRLGALTYVVNYGPTPYTIGSAGMEPSDDARHAAPAASMDASSGSLGFLVGKQVVEPQQVAIFRHVE